MHKALWMDVRMDYLPTLSRALTDQDSEVYILTKTIHDVVVLHQVRDSIRHCHALYHIMSMLSERRYLN